MCDRYAIILVTFIRCVWNLEAGKREMEFDAHAGDVVTISLAPGEFTLFGQNLLHFKSLNSYKIVSGTAKTL